MFHTSRMSRNGISLSLLYMSFFTNDKPKDVKCLPVIHFCNMYRSMQPLKKYPDRLSSSYIIYIFYIMREVLVSSQLKASSIQEWSVGKLDVRHDVYHVKFILFI